MVLLSTLKLLQESTRSPENGVTSPDPVKKPQCIPSNDQHNCFIDKQHIFPNPYNLWDMVPAALMSLNHTNDRCSMSNQYPQPTTHQSRTDSYPVISPLRWMDSERKGRRVSFAFCQQKNLPDGRVNETVATVYG